MEDNKKYCSLHLQNSYERTDVSILRRTQRKASTRRLSRPSHWRTELGKKFFSEAGAAERRGTQQSQGNTWTPLLVYASRGHKTSKEALFRGRRTGGGVHVHCNHFVGRRIRRGWRCREKRDTGKTWGVCGPCPETRRHKPAEIEKELRWKEARGRWYDRRTRPADWCNDWVPPDLLWPGSAG